MVAQIRPWILHFSCVGIVLGIAWSSLTTLSNPDRGPRDYNWERIQGTGELVIGIDPSIPPFGAYDGSNELVGLDPALGRLLATETGLEARFVVLSFDGLYDTLLLGYADIIIAALRPDPLRGDRVRYTTPYFDAGHVLVSQAGYQTLAELSGKKVAVEFASEGDLFARQGQNLEIIRFFTAREALQAAEDGEVEAALVDRISALSDSNLVISAPLIGDPYVISARRQDWRLFQALQAALSQLSADGTLDDLIATWIMEKK